MKEIRVVLLERVNEKTLKAIEELEKRGFYADGIIRYEDDQEKEVYKILDTYLLPNEETKY